MPPSDPEELLAEFLRYKRDKEQNSTEQQIIDDYLSTAGQRKTSLIPSEAYNPNGTINYGKLLAKLSNPSVLLAIIAAATNLYIEYNQLKADVAALQAENTELHQELDDTQSTMREMVDLTRNRFRSVESSVNNLQVGVSNVKTEIRVRHGAAEPDEVPQPPLQPAASRSQPMRVRRLSRAEQLRILDQETDNALERVQHHLPDDDPLAGLDF